MNRYLTFVAFLGSAVLAVGSCSEGPLFSTKEVCTAEARAGIVIEVRDSVTGDPAAAGTLGLAREGAYVDTLRGIDLALSGVHERPGTYTVELFNPVYLDWRRDGVVVTDGVCHVETVQLEARLVPRP